MADNEDSLFGIEDKTWTDRLDRRTGSVFYVSPASSTGQNTSDRPWSRRRSLSVGDLASYSLTNPGHSAGSQAPEEADFSINSSQNRSARRHMFARVYGSLKKKATRSSSRGRQSDPETVTRNVASSMNLSGKGEGASLRPILHCSSSSGGLQTKVVYPRASVEGMSSTLMQFVQGQPAESRYMWKQYGHLYHTVLYMTLDVGEEDGDDSKDILFQCPKVIGCQLSQLLKLKGVFITLNDVMKKIAGTSSSITTVYIQDQLVHVGCAQYDQEVLVVALPAQKVSYHRVQLVVEEAVQLLNYMFGSPHRAFSSTEHHPALHHVFMLMFERLLGSTPFNGGPYLDHSHSESPAMRLSETLQAVLKKELSSFEAFVSDSLSLSSPGSVTAVSSALFYKGLIVRSQLAEEDLSGVTMFLKAHYLLCLTAIQRVQQIVIWREVAAESHRSGSQTIIGQGRKFLLVLGLRNGLLCVLCCPQQLPGVGVSPNTLIVDRGRTLLLRMDAKGVFSACEQSNAENTPRVCSLDDQLVDSKQRRWGRSSFHSRSSSATNHDDEASHKGRGGAHSTTSPKQSKLRTGKQPHSSARVEDILLHYVSINSVKGTIVTPCSQPRLDGTVSPWSTGGPLHREMLMQFERMCLVLRHALHDPQQDLKEQGVLYECRARGYTEKGKQVELTGLYWIVGRRFEEGQEVYVCVADSLPPDLTDLAFRLHL